MKKPRVRFRWLVWPREGEEAIRCHAHRCDSISVSHRLCAHHAAEWLAQGRQPEMPDRYGGVDEQVGLQKEIAKDLADAEVGIARLSSLPLRTSTDAEKVDYEYQVFEKTLSAAVQRQTDSIAPLLEAAEKLEALQEPLIQRYRDGAALARMRLDAYRAGNAMPRESMPVARHPALVDGKRAARRPRRGRPSRE